MEALQSRVDSFKAHKVRNGTKTVTLKWPHPSSFAATPQTLAEAGFFFEPSTDTRDGVRCFMCAKELSEWEVDDDPFDIHFNKCQKKCPWAVLRCGLVRDIDTRGKFVFADKLRLPGSKVMEKARLATFTTNSWWPHDQTSGHGANSTRMAQAGFIYSPQFPGDDLATCLYCNVSLSGWDGEDDPLEEHRKRERKAGVLCPFFASQGSVSSDALPAPTKPPSTRAPASAASTSKPKKAHTRSKSQSRAPIVADTYEATKDEDEEAMATPDEDDAPAILPKKGAKTPRKPRGTGSTATSSKAPRTLTRARSKASVISAMSAGEDVDAEEPPLPVPAKAKASKARASSRKPSSRIQSRAPSVQSESDAGDHVDTGPGDDEAVQPPKKGRKTVNGKGGKAKAKGTAKAPTIEEDAEPVEMYEDLEVELVDEESPPVPKPTNQKSLRKSTRSRSTSVSIAKAKPASKASKTASKKAQSEPEPGSASESEDMVTAAEEFTPRTPPKPTKSKTDSRTSKQLRQTADEESPSETDLEKSGPAASVAAALNAAMSLPVKGAKARDKSKPLVDEDKTPKVNKPPVETKADKKLGVRKPPSNKGKTSTSRKVSRMEPEAEPEVVQISSEDEVDNLTHFEAPEKPVEAIKPKSSTNAKAQPIQDTVFLDSNRGNTVIVESSKTSEVGQANPSRSFDMDTPSQSTPRNPTEKPIPSQPPSLNDSGDLEMEDAPEPITPPQLGRNDLRSGLGEVGAKLPGPEPSLESLPGDSNVCGVHFHPPLSVTPFQALEQLTEAELSMTVEEWIRYQMQTEAAKFRRDGERELARFQERAEEVRRAIGAL